MTWFFNNESVPVISIIDENENQLFSTAGHMALQVSPSKTFSEHTLENGQVVTDNVIDNRTSASLQLILSPDDYTDVYNDIKSIYNTESALTIVSRVDIYRNMYIQALPHQEDSSISNTIAIYLDLIEQQIVDTNTEVLKSNDVASQSDKSTAQSGQKTPAKNKTLLLQGADYLGFLK